MVGPNPIRMCGRPSPGSTIVLAGALCIAGVRRLDRGQRIGWERALWGTLFLLVIAFPLRPMQPELAGGLSTVSVINLVVLLGAWLPLRRHWLA
jgi:hypothetical protein